MGLFSIKSTMNDKNFNFFAKTLILLIFLTVSPTISYGVSRKCPKGSFWSKKRIRCVKWKKKKKKKLKKIKVQMVKISKGSYIRSDIRRRKAKGLYPHKVTITKPYYIGIYEVTQKLWKTVTGKNPSGHKNCESCPVENISWLEILTFCNKLSVRNGYSKCYKINLPDIKWVKNCTGYRLPTESEWEFSARGDGKPVKNVDSVMWHKGNSNLDYNRRTFSTKPVGTKLKNSFGIYDTMGNVFEWVWDWYNKYSTKPLIDPRGPATGTQKVFKGGSYISVFYAMSLGRRYKHQMHHKYKTIGFRLARSVKMSVKVKTKGKIK
jgi:formylglycine-generating enzyme required for sulfatase activity